MRYLYCLLLTAIALAASLDCSIGLISRLLNSIFLIQHWRISYIGSEFFLRAFTGFRVDGSCTYRVAFPKEAVTRDHAHPSSAGRLKKIIVCAPMLRFFVPVHQY